MSAGSAVTLRAQAWAVASPVQKPAAISARVVCSTRIHQGRHGPLGWRSLQRQSPSRVTVSVDARSSGRVRRAEYARAVRPQARALAGESGHETCRSPVSKASPCHARARHPAGVTRRFGSPHGADQAGHSPAPGRGHAASRRRRARSDRTGVASQPVGRCGGRAAGAAFAPALPPGHPHALNRQDGDRPGRPA